MELQARGGWLELAISGRTGRLNGGTMLNRVIRSQQFKRLLRSDPAIGRARAPESQSTLNGWKNPRALPLKAL